MDIPGWIESLDEPLLRRHLGDTGSG